MPAILPKTVSADAAAYRPDIDGLRAAAVLGVILFHAFPAIVPGGFVGVDVFFVISGYLISGLIMGALDDERFSFAAFYARRARRLLPALIAVLACVLAYGFVVLLPVELAALGRDDAGGAFFVSNLVQWREAGYFDRAAASKPLLHLWSLGIEEQFYLAWPLLLTAIARFRRWRAALMAAAAVASFVLNVTLTHAHAEADFFSPFTRVWELAAGALLAELGTRVTLPPAASYAGAALVLGAAFGLSPAAAYPGWAAVLPVTGTALLIGGTPRHPVNRALCGGPAVYVGLISYPLYLWHWPLISYATIIRRGHALTPLLAAALIAAGFALAAATYHLLEKPIRRRFGWPILLMLACGLGFAGGAGIVVAAARGFPGRFPALPEIDVARINAAAGDGIFKPTPGMVTRMEDGTTISTIGRGADPILFTGDSLLYHFGPRVQALLDAGRLAHPVIFVAGPSCVPIPGVVRPGLFAHCTNMVGIDDRLIAQRNIGTVVIGAHWLGVGGPDVCLRANSVTMALTRPAMIDAAYAQLGDWVARLRHAGRRVFLILAQPATDRFNPREMIARSPWGFRIAPGVGEAVPLEVLRRAQARANGLLAAIARRTGASLLDPMPDVCGAGPGCAAFYGAGEPKFADDKHLRPGFVRGHITFIDPLLTQ